MHNELVAIDEELMGAVAQGSRDALGALYSRHAAALRRRARMFCREDDAHDIVHDTFESLMARAHQFDRARGDVRAWLSRIVKNRALDFARAQGRRSLRLRLETVPEKGNDGGIEQATFLRQLCDRAAVSRDIETTLCDVFGRGLSYAEAAEERAVPVGTAKTRAHRGLVALRDVA
jgi:RNA polymerase sigma-70 factor, ECF subfamily